MVVAMLDLQPIKDRLAAATPGPWEREFTEHIAEDMSLDASYTSFIIGKGVSVGEMDMPADCELVAHAPTDLAALVAEVERLRAAIEEHQRAVKPGNDYCGADVILWRALDA